MNQKDISEAEVLRFKNLLDVFRQFADLGVTPEIEKQLLVMLDFSLPFFIHLITEDRYPELHRITVNKSVLKKNKRIRDIKYLKYPPAHLVSQYGRCNYPGQSILYASLMEITALGELRPRVGDLITISTWTASSDIQLKICPIFKNQPEERDVINPRMYEFNEMYEKRIAVHPTYMREQFDALIQFVADGFSKRISKANALDYIFSAYFSNKIFHQFENGTIDAILYPSVPGKLSFENLAIKPDVFDSHYRLTKVYESVVRVDPSTGASGYMMDGILDCQTFNYVSGEIHWEKDKFNQSPEHLAFLKDQYAIDFD